MPQRVWLAIALFLLATPALPSDDLSDRVADQFRQTLAKADRALADGDHHLAMALLEGALYTTGVRVAIDAHSLDPRGTDQEEAVRQAFSTWSESLDGDFPIQLVGDSENYDVVIRFVDSIPDAGAHGLGLIKVTKNYRWSSQKHEVKYSGSIQVVRAAPGGRLSPAETLDVVMHELGHLLGLADVARIGDLMGPLVRGKPVLRPTEPEVNAVKDLRKTIRRRIKLVQANLPPSGTSGEYTERIMHLALAAQN
ncbi:MAG: matrixin family metalloprotease [Armatimonadetes bacterium]|nr:matrixin family metalloprotease [Armatimonadota bacterium]